MRVFHNDNEWSFLCEEELCQWRRDVSNQKVMVFFTTDSMFFVSHRGMVSHKKSAIKHLKRGTMCGS